MFVSRIPTDLFDFHVGLSIYSDDCPMPYRRSNPESQRRRLIVPRKPTTPGSGMCRRETKWRSMKPNRGSVRMSLFGT
jgi:hypothetical protein